MLSGSRNTSTDPYTSSAIGDCVSGLSAVSARHDTVGFEVRLPGLQVGAAGDRETRVVEPGGRLPEEARIVRVVVVQHDHQIPRGVGKDLADPTGMRAVHLMGHVEDVLVPPHAPIEIGDGERDVVQARSRDCGHGASVVQAAAVMRSR